MPQPEGSIDVRRVAESTGEDDRPRLLTVGISLSRNLNAKRVDSYALGKLGVHCTDHSRIAWREDLDTIETTPDGQLIRLPAASLRFTERPLDPTYLSPILATR